MCIRGRGGPGEGGGVSIISLHSSATQWKGSLRAAGCVLTWDKEGKVITSGHHSLTLAFLHRCSHIPTLAALFKDFPLPKALPFLGCHHGSGIDHKVQSPCLWHPRWEEPTFLKLSSWMMLKFYGQHLLLLIFVITKYSNSTFKK